MAQPAGSVEHRIRPDRSRPRGKTPSWFEWRVFQPRLRPARWGPGQSRRFEIRLWSARAAWHRPGKWTELLWLTSPTVSLLFAPSMMKDTPTDARNRSPEL